MTSVAEKRTAMKRAAPKPDRNFVAALNAGLPRSVAHALAARRVVVVELTSNGDTVAKLASGEARTGAVLAGASFVRVNVDSDGGDVEVMAKLLGRLPVAPATLVYARPATLYVTLNGFNDRTTVQQAAANAAVSTQTSSTTTRAATAPAATPAVAG